MKKNKYEIFNLLHMNKFRYDNEAYKPELPLDIFVVAYHRRFVKKATYLFSQYQPQLIAAPLIP